jgi:hypothetical protein
MSKFALCAKARVKFCSLRVSSESAQPVIAAVDKAGLLRIRAKVAMAPDNRKSRRKCWSRFQQGSIPGPGSAFLIKEKAATVEVHPETFTYGYM